MYFHLIFVCDPLLTAVWFYGLFVLCIHISQGRCQASVFIESFSPLLFWILFYSQIKYMKKYIYLNNT